MANIRGAQIADYSSINWLSHYLDYEPLSLDVARSNLEYLLSSSNDHVWVCENQDQVVGWIHLLVSHRLATAQFAEIGGIVVDPAFYRNGFGRSLIYHAKLWTETHQLKLRVRCETSREDALKFYDSVGFKHLKTQQVLEFSH